MEMILRNDERIASVGMLVPAIGEQKDGAKICGPSPELGQEFALDANVFDPLVVDDGVFVVGAVPTDDGVDDFRLVFDGRNLFGERDVDRLRRFGIEMNLLWLAEEVAGFNLPVLTFALVRRHVERAAVPEVESFVNVEQSLD